MIKIGKNFLNILYALILREINLKFNRGYLSYLWIIFEPIIHLVVLLLIFTIFRATTITSINITIFIISGLIPWFIFQRGFGESIGAYNSGKALSNYRQISYLYVLISKIFLNFIIYLMTFFIMLTILSLIGIEFYIYNLINMIISLVLLFFLTTSVSLIAFIISFYFPDFAKLKEFMIRPLYLASGIFFTYNSVPYEYKEYFLLNPIFQLIELTRYSFIQYEIPDFISIAYILKFILTTFSLGIGLYFINREKLIRNDLARE